MDIDFLTTTEAAALLRLPVGTLRYYRHLATGPRSAKLGRKVVYARADIEAWAAEQVAQTSRGGTDVQQRAA